MKLATCMVLGGAGLASLIISLSLGIQGCSSSSSGGDGGGGGNANLTHPPARPSGGGAATSTEINFALHQVMLGDTNNNQDWKKYGYDIDGLDLETDTARAASACTPINNGNNKKLVNGPGGIDNSFGENLVPVLADLQANLSQTISDSLNQGHFTIMLDTVGLDTTATQTATGLSAKLLGGGLFAQTPNGTSAQPTWSPADNWPVNPDFLSNPSDAKSAKISFSNAYVANGTWVSGDPSDAELSLTVQGVALTIPVKHAVVTFQHSAAGKATSGIVSGVINTEALVASLGSGALGSLGLCPGSSSFTTIANQIRSYSDILDDGTNKAGVPCNAISIGLGFTADQIGAPQTVAAPSTGSSSCNGDGGVTPTDAGGTTPDSGGGGTDSGGSQDAATE
jgi:hypothetical protein